MICAEPPDPLFALALALALLALALAFALAIGFPCPQDSGSEVHNEPCLLTGFAWGKTPSKNHVENGISNRVLTGVLTGFKCCLILLFCKPEIAFS